jgi:hypothetical protein
MALGLALAWPGILVLMYGSHTWILDARGKPVVTDFLEVWVAGKATLAGQAAAAYNPKLHYAAEATAAGHAFHGHLWWHYPPQVLFLAAALALLPYLAAFLLWVGSTGAAYAAAVWAIAKSRAAPFIALGAPAAFLNAVCGQNGYLSAAIIGAALLNIEARPILGGVFLGILSYKPQLGILFPIVLVAAGRWRALFAAASVTLLSLAAPAIIIGGDTIRAFLHYLPLTGETMLVDNATGWSKLQSIYALARFLGLGNCAAWTFQSAAVLLCVAALVWLWRREGSYALKAAALAVAPLLATPYIYMYDFPIMAVPLAFLFRERGFDTVELVGIGLANALALGYAFGVWVAPVGPLAALLVSALVIRRACRESYPAMAGALAPAHP